uniref:Uncharacterized protein n=1 Tax=Rhizophora mucronata TaxID=61149 RepID=A0A2P2Q980_RHIMU
MHTGPKPEDLRFEVCNEEDSLIMAWLWSHMISKISNTCIFLATTKDIGDAI